MTDQLPNADALLAEQIEYYRARAPEYDDWWLRVGLFNRGDEFEQRWEGAKQDLRDALRAFAPIGDVLELAAGTGNLTCELAAIESVSHVTALDSSDETLAIALTKLPDQSKVTFVTADLFAWEPSRRYDVVAFGFWLSHVPPGQLAAFWDLVHRALVPGGRVFFIDNAVPVEVAATENGRKVQSPTSQTWLDQAVSLRTLNDGRAFHIVKRAWSPEELEAELASFGWTGTVKEHRRLFIHGEAARAETGRAGTSDRAD